MTRSASLLRAFATVVAGGSFVAAAPAPEAAPAAKGAADPSSFSAASLSVTPLRVDVNGSGAGSTVQLMNTSDRPLPVQSRLFAWSQVNGVDVYTPSNDMVVSPSITQIPAGQVQVVRLLRKTDASPGEKRYRLVVDQLPDPVHDRNDVAQTRIRFTIPVFVDSDKAAPAQLSWKVGKGGLEVTNAGGATARIFNVQAKKGDGSIVALDQSTLRYVQGSSTITYAAKNGCSLGAIRWTAQVDGQAVDGLAPPSCG